MNRANLVWFCGGAAASSIAGLAAFVLQPPDEELRWFLLVAENSESSENRLVTENWPTAAIARNCGAKVFDAIPGDGIEEGDKTRVPLTAVNRTAMGCIVERAREANLWVGIRSNSSH